MGWASGSRAMNELIATFNETIGKTDHQIPEAAIIDFWKRVISSFEDEDWDTQGESLGEDPIWDKAFFAEHPWEAGYHCESINSVNPYKKGTRKAIEWAKGYAERLQESEGDGH